MYQTITKSQFVDSFRDMNREDNFSYSGLCALYDWFEQMEEDTGSPIELDVIAICCEFSEYEDIDEICNAYDDIDNLQDLYGHTSVIEFPGGIIIQDF
jgi:hypothetical protein